jgi:hypothetical protein
MKCEDKFKDVTYGKGEFCKSCGMDLGLNPIKSRDNFYCCEECVDI